MEPQAQPPAPDTAIDPALAARVAAWHNRHPLALRIQPAQVQGLGVVALPFSAGEGAAARAKPAFGDNFIPPIKPRQVAAFALRHGLKDRPDITPLREVAADGDAAGATLTLLYLHTAAVEAGGQRVRVLIGSSTAGGAGGPAGVAGVAGAGGLGRARLPILGPRLWSLPRTLAAAALAGAVSSALVAAVGVGLWQWQAAPAGPVLAAVSAPESTPPSAATATPPADVPATAPAPAIAVSAASAASAPTAPSAASPSAASPPAASPPAAPPVVALATAPATSARSASQPAPTGNADPLAAKPADIRPALSGEQRAAAREQAQRLRGESARPSATPSATAAGPAVTGDAAADAAAAPVGSRSFALVTRTTRGRAASEVMLSLMASASAASGAAFPGQPRTEVMQVQQGFRAVWWPFASPDDAALARSALAAYGINAEIVEF